MKYDDAVRLVDAALARNGGPGQTFIYFMQAEHGGPIKIGRSTHPAQRLRECQCGNPFRLRITHLEVGKQVDEQRLHKLFAPYRLVGEWFQPLPLLAGIARAIPDESIEGGIENTPVVSGCWVEQYKWQSREQPEYKREEADCEHRLEPLTVAHCFVSDGLQ